MKQHKRIINSITMYHLFFKRLFDFLNALVGLILLSPLFILITILLFFANHGSGVFFTQERPGKNEKIFKIIKFKTMTDARDAKGNLLPDSSRLTSIGKFIRSCSLDEIPQLINIIKGDMSIVGPRPLRTHYLPYYNEYERQRHNIRPGLTGLAQINGRNNIDWESKFKLDILYIEKLTLWLDIMIILKSIPKIYTNRDLGTSGIQTLEDFDIYRKSFSKR